jgi:deoxyribose-phosphate aldolase
MTDLRQLHLGRNEGIPLDLAPIEEIQVNRSAVERRTATLTGRRTVKKQWQAAWLSRVITVMDLTTLAGDDTRTNVHRLCQKAAHPLKAELVDALQLGELKIQTGAVCVYPEMVPFAVEALQGTGIPVAAVAAGFPHGLTSMRTRIAEIEEAVSLGAEEIDIVISRRKVLAGEWESLYEEVAAFRKACGPAHLKVILATGELDTLRNVAKASMVSMMAGADFIKTSTGKESVNATREVGLVMARMIRDYQAMTGYRVGFKPAGGIRTAKQAMDWLILMKEELGDPWTKPDLFRMGASTLLADIERQLEHYAFGRYGAFHRNPMG